MRNVPYGDISFFISADGRNPVFLTWTFATQIVLGKVKQRQ
jgi:hypothetical protein